MAAEQFEFCFPESFGWRAPLMSHVSHDRYFIGLQPDPETEGRIADAAQLFLRRLDVKEPQRPFHLSLLDLGPSLIVPEQRLIEAKEALSVIRFEPFGIVLDQIASFRNSATRKPLVLMSSERNQPPGMEPPSVRGFTPHVTLFYTRRKVPQQDLRPPIGWTIRRFHIIRSYVGETRHERLWTWPPDA